MKLCIVKEEDIWTFCYAHKLSVKDSDKFFDKFEQAIHEIPEAEVEIETSVFGKTYQIFNCEPETVTGILNEIANEMI